MLKIGDKIKFTIKPEVYVNPEYNYDGKIGTIATITSNLYLVKFNPENGYLVNLDLTDSTYYCKLISPITMLKDILEVT